MRALNVGCCQVGSIRRIVQKTSEVCDDMSVQRLRSIADQMSQQPISATVRSKSRRRFKEAVRQCLFGSGSTRITYAVNVAGDNGMAEPKAAPSTLR